MTQPSISRQFARWTANLRYEDLPPEVVDKTKALMLHALTSAVFGSQIEAARHTVALTLAEEGKADGATIGGGTRGPIGGAIATHPTQAKSLLVHAGCA